MKKQGKLKIMILVEAVILVALLIAGGYFLLRQDTPKDATDPTNTTPSTSDHREDTLAPQDDTTVPRDVTWEEYTSFSKAQQEEFYESFSDPKDFENWMEQAKEQSANPVIPWDEGGKQPAEYTWAEYQALSNTLQEFFYESFESDDAFHNWMEQAKENHTETLPHTKQPEEYSWEEYEAMTTSQQELFYESFESDDAFHAWMEQAKARLLPWNNGGKQPKDYTWEEYEALTTSQQEEFYESFETHEAFLNWLDQAQSES